MKIIKKLLPFALLFMLFTYSVYAVSIGVSPGRVKFENLLQEGYAERIITISTNTEDILNGHFNVNGEIKDWLSFEPHTNTFSLSKGNPYKLKIIIQPPSDIRNGNYSGNIEFVTDTVGSVAGRAGGIVKAAVTMTLNSEVSGIEIIECRAGGFNLKDIEVGFPLELGVTVANDGNVRLSPTITLDVWDQLQENLLLSQSVVGDEVLPTTEKSMFRRISNNLDVGQYWVNLNVEECNAADFRTFSVVEKGGIVDKGTLSGILNKPSALVGETIEFVAKFVNNGKRAVNAKFKGTIRLEDKIVKVIETEEIIVPAGETGDISIFFTPEEPGRYSLTGRVVYNKKLTFEKGASLDVNKIEEEKKKFEILPLILYVTIIITILFIVRKIMKERRKKRIF
jgi:hypothetical protein